MSRIAVCIETYGCSFNVSDGEVLAGILAREGYELVTCPDEADVIILNTCTVKDRTYWEFEKRFGYLKKAAAEGSGPRVILTGCIPKAYERTELLAGVSALGPDALRRIGEVVRETLAGRTIQFLGGTAPDQAEVDRPNLPVRRHNPTVEILPIAAGCLSACSFCQTRLARGRLTSFRPADILQRARQAVAEGVRELWVTAQDTGAYGKDCNYPLPRLLGQLCELEGDFRIRLGMSSPIWIWEDLKDYLEALAHPRMFRFLHVPVQSGSDCVLKAMKRGNTAAQFIAICDAFHERFPEGLLMTDVIVGFPGEGERDFAQTLELLERSRPAAINRSKFSARPGTAAAKMKALASNVVSERSLRLNETALRLARSFNEPLLGRRERVLTGEIMRNGAMMAHNDAYRPVILPETLPLGSWVEVEYAEMGDYHLKGRLAHTATKSAPDS